MVVKASFYPDDALELTNKKALSCCDRPNVLVDRFFGLLLLRCQNCPMKVSIVEKRAMPRTKNVLKRRQAALQAMAKAIDELVTKWNVKVITGMDDV